MNSGVANRVYINPLTDIHRFSELKNRVGQGDSSSYCTDSIKFAQNTAAAFILATKDFLAPSHQQAIAELILPYAVRELSLPGARVGNAFLDKGRKEAHPRMLPVLVTSRTRLSCECQTLVLCCSITGPVWSVGVVRSTDRSWIDMWPEGNPNDSIQIDKAGFYNEGAACGLPRLPSPKDATKPRKLMCILSADYFARTKFIATFTVVVDGVTLLTQRLSDSEVKFLKQEITRAETASERGDYEDSLDVEGLTIGFSVWPGTVVKLTGQSAKPDWRTFTYPQSLE